VDQFWKQTINGGTASSSAFLPCQVKR